MWIYLSTSKTDSVIFQKLEGRVASDEDLKLSDTVRYYMRDSEAAKDLLYRRTRALVDYENANKNLEKARTKNKDVPQVTSIITVTQTLLFVASRYHVKLAAWSLLTIPTVKAIKTITLSEEKWSL